MSNLFSNQNIYRNTYDVERRIQESRRIVTKHPHLVPVIVDFDEGLIGKVSKRKFLISRDVSCMYLLTAFRKQIVDGNSSVSGLFMFSDDMLITPSKMMGELYDDYHVKKQYKNSKNNKELEDLFLYVYITKENTFG